MAERSIYGFDRRCRKCAKWSYEEGPLDVLGECPFCGAAYGRLSLGDDVPRRRNPPPQLGKAERQAIREAKAAMKVSKPKPGEYRHK